MSAPRILHLDVKDEEITLNDLIERMATANRVNSGRAVTPDNAMKCTTVHGIVRALTNAIGSYPPSVGRIETADAGQYFKSTPDHQTNRLLKRPNAVQTPTQYYRMIMSQLALHGNHYALKGQGQTGPISFLRPIENPNAVDIDDVSWGTGVRYKINFDDGREEFFNQNQVLHITSGIPDTDGVRGKSPVMLAREAIGICLAAEQLIAELYGNNAIPTLVITGAAFANEEQYTTWADRWRAMFGAGKNRGGTAMLKDGMDIKEVAFKPVDAQVMEMRKFQRIEIAQVYGVPPHKLADLERATFSNIEEQSLEFVRDVAKPWVRLIEQAMTKSLLTDADQRAGSVIRFDMEAATEGKLKDRIEAYAKARDSGAMNPNEIRQRLGMDPRTDEGGEEFVTPLNMRGSDELPDDSEGTETDEPDSQDDA